MWKIDATEIITRLTRLEEQCAARERHIQEQDRRLEELLKAYAALAEKLENNEAVNRRDAQQKPAEALISEWLSGVEA